MIERKPYRTVDWRGRSIKRPFPWERDMTVCIAAICHEDNDQDRPAIVLCTDARVGGSLGSSEWAFKQVHIGGTWHALTAGDAPDIVTLIKLFQIKFAEPNALLAENIDRSIKDVLFERKKQLAEEFIRDRFAITFDEFSQYGKVRLPEDLFREAMRQLREIDLKAEFILAGYVDGTPEIYSFDGSGRVGAANDYAVCGSGYYLAHAALMRREQSVMCTVERGLYNVFEAKKLSEAVRSCQKLWEAWDRGPRLVFLSKTAQKESAQTAWTLNLRDCMLNMVPSASRTSRRSQDIVIMQKKKPNAKKTQQESPKSQDSNHLLSKQETETRRDDAIRRALTTPPKPLETFKGRSLSGSLVKPKSRAS